MKFLKRFAALTLLAALLLAVAPEADDGAVYLGDRQDLMTARESLDGMGFNKAHSGEKITVWELSFKKGLGFHCLPDKDAYVEFDVSSLGMKYFAATVGVLKKANYYIELGDISFSVYGDGKLLAQTPVIAWNAKPAYICVNVEGVSTLRLVENNAGNYACDAGVWGDAALYMTEPEEPEWYKEDKNAFDPNRTDLPQPAEAVSGDSAYISDLYFLDSNTYTGNVAERDCNTAHEIIFSTDGKFFEKGLGLHATSDKYTSYVDVNIEGLGFTAFASYYGVCETLTSHDISMASVRFALIGDGKTLFESGVMKYGEPMQPMKADITGVKVLRLAISGVPTISGAWGTWGGAVLSKSGDIKDEMLYKNTGIEDLFSTTDTDAAESSQPAESTAEPAVTTSADTAESGEKSGGKHVGVIVAAAVAAAAAVVAALVLIKKRK